MVVFLRLEVSSLDGGTLANGQDKFNLPRLVNS
jgi:hypothetical protein